MLVEREAEAGGAVRHCGHRGFGMLDFGRVWTGPAYAARLRERVAGVDLRTGHAALRLESDGRVELSGPQGPYRIAARRLLLATGTRETPRAARLVSGGRPFGVMNTGALQRFVYLHHVLPCRNPVIVGHELVAFSAILTLRHLGGRPAMILGGAPGERAPAWARLGALLAYGVPVRTGAEIRAILGTDRVEGILIRQGGQDETIACDGVIFSGGWLPEASLAHTGHIGIDPRSGGPLVDAGLRTADPKVFAAGNVLGPARSSGPVALEGRRVGRRMALELRASPSKREAR